MFARVGRFVGRFWWLVLAAWVAACLASAGAPKLSQVGKDDSVEFLGEQSDAKKARDLLQRAFPNYVYQSSAVVIVETPDGFDEHPEYAELANVIAIGIRRLCLRPLVPAIPELDTDVTTELAAPAEAPTLATADEPGPLTGRYQYCWLYARKGGAGVVDRSDASPPSAPITLQQGRVVIDGLVDSPDPNATHKELYRTRAGDPASFYRVAALPRGATTFTDDLTDLALDAKPVLMIPAIKKVTAFTEPIIGQRFYISRDRQATIITVAIDDYWLATRALLACKHIRRLVTEEVAAWQAHRKARGLPQRRVAAYTTGYAPVGLDYIDEAAISVHNTEKTTYLMVVVILLVVYRSPLLAVIPLVTVGVSVFCSWAVLASLALLLPEFKVINITDIFVIVILFGAGTDYCLFLIARAREGLDSGLPVTQAVGEAVGAVGGTLAASAGTVICGLGMMIFAVFAKFRYTGPAVAVSLVVGLCAALTLAPSLLCLLGRSAFWTPLGRRQWEWLRRKFSRCDGGKPTLPRGPSYWERLSDALVRRPGTILVVCFLVMLPLALLGADVKVTYDLLVELPGDKEAVRGIRAIQEHFTVGEIDPIKLLLYDKNGRIDFRRAEVRAAIERLSAKLAAFPGVAMVRGLTRPLGEPPEESARTEPTDVPAVDSIFDLGRNLVNGIEQLAQQELERYYLSSDGELAGRVIRFQVVLDMEPFATEAMAKLEQMRELVTAEVNHEGSPLAGVECLFAGATGVTNDLRRVTDADSYRVRLLVVLGIFLILVALLRRVGVSLYLILSVVFSYYVTMGVTRLVFNVALGYPGLHWTVPFFLFVLLIAVGEDYNIFLMARVEEESARHGRVEGIRLAVARTGAIITSCGVIMAGTFASMLTGTLSALVELGLALAFGVLLDTFVVRPILVPTFLLVLERWRGKDASEV